MANDKTTIMMVAIVAIVAITAVLGPRQSLNLPSGRVVEADAAAVPAAEPPEPTPVPFAMSECGNGLCEVPFEECNACEKDCGPCM